MSSTKLSYPHTVSMPKLQAAIRRNIGMPSVTLVHEAPEKAGEKHLVHLRPGQYNLASLPVEKAPENDKITVTEAPKIPRNKLALDHNFAEEIALALKKSA